MTVNREPGRTGIQSLHRALDIVEIVATRGSVGASEIAHELDLAVSTVHNLARTLAARGYLVGQRGTYRLGPGTAWLTSRWEPMTVLPELTRPHLEMISKQTGQSASATVLVDTEARLLAFMPGASSVAVQQPRWTWPSPLDLATGTVLVALAEQRAWEDHLRHRTPEENWEQRLERIAATGVHARRSVGPTGQTAVAVAVRTAAGPVCSVGSAAPTFVATDELVDQMLQSLLTASRSLSEELGCAEPALPSLAVAREAVELDLGATGIADQQ